MRKLFTARTRFAIALCGVYLFLSLAVGMTSVFGVDTAVEEQGYLSKISIGLDFGEAPIDCLDGFKARAGELCAESVEAVVRFDFDYKDTAEYRDFLFERDGLETQADVDDFRRRLAASSDTYHTNMLTRYLGGVSFSAEAREIGYSPFVRLSSQDAEALYDDIVSFAKSKNVKSVEVFSQNTTDAPLQSESGGGTAVYLTHTEMLEEIGGSDIVGNGQYTGNNVKVGINELDWLANNLFSNVVYRATPGAADDHARAVCATVRSIAPDSTLYFSDVQGTAGTNKPDFSWYIDELVPVINCSWGLVSSTQNYQSRDEYTDYQVQTHFINVVVSAGNAKKDSGANTTNGIKITSPGYARNAVTVTGTETLRDSATGEEWKTHSPSASYSTPYDIPKPTLAAPLRINIPTPNSLTSNTNRDLGGTSIAAPQVTAALALLFEKEPTLSVFPERVLARLEASADHTVTNDYDNLYFSAALGNRHMRLGSGVLNIERLLNQTGSERIVIENNNLQGQTIAQRQVYLTAGQAFKANAYWLGEFAHSNGGSHITNYDLQLFNSSNVKVAFSESTTSYSEIITFTPAASGTYSLRIVQTEPYNGKKDIIGLAYTTLGLSIHNNVVTGFVTPPGFNGNLLIPNTVTAIGASAFAGNTDIISVAFESGSVCHTVGAMAFENCMNLYEIALPDSVSSVGLYAFYGCLKLASVTKTSAAAHSTGSLGTTFSAWQTLESLPVLDYPGFHHMGQRQLWVTYTAYFDVFGTVEYQLRLIDTATGTVFSTASYLPGDGQNHTCVHTFNSVAIANIAENHNLQIQMRYRKTNAAWGGHFTVTGEKSQMRLVRASGIIVYEGMVIVDGVVTAFYPPPGFNGHAVVPHIVTAIGDYAFAHQYGLTEVTLPASVTSIGVGAFVYCSNLEKVNIPSSVTVIKQSAFAMCHNLADVTFGAGSKLKIIEAYAFFCTGITDAVLPPGVEQIGARAFEGIFYYDGNASMAAGGGDLGDAAFTAERSLGGAVWNSEDWESLNEALLAWKQADLDGLLWLDSGLMSGSNMASPLASVWIPLSVTVIDAYAFANCPELTIYAEATSKPPGWHADWNPDNRPVVWGSPPPGSELPGYYGTKFKLPFTSAAQHTIQFTPTQNGNYKFDFCDVDCCKPKFVSVSGNGVSQQASGCLKVALIANETYTVTFAATPCSPSKPGQFKIDKC